jgi:hypothetical protein
VVDDRDATFLTGRLALDSFLCKVPGQLIRTFTDRQSLDSHVEPGMVHHREHAGEPPVFLTDEISDRTVSVAISYDTGRAGVNAEFVLDRRAVRVVAIANAAVVVYKILWHEEKRYSSYAVRRVR